MTSVSLDIFVDNIKPLRDISVDGQGETCAFMTECTNDAVYFDGVMKDYIHDLNVSETPKSIDALIIREDAQMFFIEFRNGKLDSSDSHEIRQKIFNSVFVLTDIYGKGISYMRDFLSFILVYNESKNASSYSIIAQATSKLADAKIVKLGLGCFRNYCFKSVFTYTENELREKVDDLFHQAAGQHRVGMK